MDLDALERFIRLAAARTGQEFNLASLAENVGIHSPQVEVKSARSVAADALAGLQWWTRLAAERASGGALIYGGDAAMVRQGFAVRPWSLW